MSEYRAAVEWWNVTDWRKLNNSERNLSHTTLSITNSIWTAMCMNPGLLSEQVVTNHLSYGTAMILLSEDIQ
jgi:hypothetical protein